MISLYYNETGQTVYFDCPEGRPTSVSVSVFSRFTGDDGTAESALDTPAVETNPNTTVDAASGVSQADPKTLNIAATTGVAVGRTYLATNAESLKEWVNVVGFESGVSVTARHALLNDYASADTFASTRVTAAVLDAWIQDITNISDDLDPNPGYRVRWEYVVDSVTYVHDEYINIVRYDEQHTVTPQMVDAVSPGWINTLPSEYRDDQGRRLIDEAWNELRVRLHGVDVPIETIRNKNVLNRLVIRLVPLMQLDAQLQAGGNVDPFRLDRAEKNFDNLFESLIKLTNKTDTATDATGAGSKRQAIGILEK